MKVPNHQQWYMQNGSSVGTCTQRIHVFARFAPILHAPSVLINKISASELSREVYHECAVGRVGREKTKMLLAPRYNYSPSSYETGADKNGKIKIKKHSRVFGGVEMLFIMLDSADVITIYYSVPSSSGCSTCHCCRQCRYRTVY